MDNEKWINIKGFEKYFISSHGNVKSIKSGEEKILKQRYSKKKYKRVNLYIKSKPHTFFVHTLVAKNFIVNNDSTKITVNHKNGMKTDNRVENLEWVSMLENLNHAVENKLHNFGEKHPLCKFSDLQVLEIRKLYSLKKYKQKELSVIYNVNQGHISAIINKKLRKQ